MLYLGQVIIYTGLMLLIYIWMLRDKPMHHFNRLYLLSAVLIPLLIPLLKLPEVMRPQAASGIFISSVLPDVVITAGAKVERMELPVWLFQGIALYLLVMFVIAVIKLRQYMQLRRLIKATVKEARQGYVLLKNTGYGPGSWGKYIFLPAGDVDAAIIRHELQHIKLRHSRDNDIHQHHAGSYMAEHIHPFY